MLAAERIACHSTVMLDVRRFVDSRYLTFAEIDARIGNVRPVRRAVQGRTFELQIPWETLKIRPDAPTTFTVQIENDQGILRIPTETDEQAATLVFAD